MTSGQKFGGKVQIYQFDSDSYDLSFFPLPDSGLFARSRACQGKEDLIVLLSAMGLDRQDIEWTLESLDEDGEAYIPM